MKLLSLAIGKLVFFLLRATGRTGSALPGLVVEKISPKFLSGMLTQIPEGTIIVSGTNGKTTTTKIIVSLLESQGMRVLTNKTGSNFVRGIISAVVDKTSWTGNLAYDIAVFEQDEAHAVRFSEQVSPRGVVVLNIMRDQMDRFGEIDTTREMLQKLATSATNWVVLNANDERVSTIRPANGVQTLWYAHTEQLQKQFLTDDQLYHAESAAFYQAAEPDVVLQSFTSSNVELRAGQTDQHYGFHLPGGHNALNLVAAMAVLGAVMPEYDTDKVTATLGGLVPAFGRGETISLPNGGTLTLQLIKNPGGFTQALRMLSLKHYTTVGISINDDYADGRDVSWLWDVNFSAIGSPVLCGGTRAADMANRLKYDEVALQSVNDDMETFITAFNGMTASHSGDAILYCTYTAMRQIRSHYIGAHSGLEDV